jgi:hypothetical protein
MGTILNESEGTKAVGGVYGITGAVCSPSAEVEKTACSTSPRGAGHF